MKGPRAHSSDLDLARLLSQRLRSPRENPGARYEPSPRYVRFEARRVVPEAVPAWRRSDQPFGPEVWNQLLDGCLAAADGRAAFLLDAQGLSVAVRGDVTPEIAESLGARMSVALDQAQEMAAGAPSAAVCLEWEGSWLTGLRLASAAEPLTVCVLARGPIGGDARELIENLLGGLDQV